MCAWHHKIPERYWELLTTAPIAVLVGSVARSAMAANSPAPAKHLSIVAVPDFQSVQVTTS